MTDERQAAPSTVTITLSEKDADIVHSALICAEWEAQIDEEDSHRIQGILRTAARPPAPSDSLEQAITSCHDLNFNLSTWPTEGGGYGATVTSRTYPLLRPMTYRGEGATLIEAIRAALAAASGEPAQEGQ